MRAQPLHMKGGRCLVGQRLMLMICNSPICISPGGYEVVQLIHNNIDI